jgi:hypothetical protein
MKTIIHGMIDGQDVILAFSTIEPDAEATRVKIAPMLENIPEAAQLSALTQKIADRRNEARQSFLSTCGHDVMTGLQTQGEANLWSTLNSQAEAEVAVMAEGVPALAKSIWDQTQALRNQYAVYSMPPKTGYASEDLASDADHDRLKALADALPKGQRLTMDGVAVEDNRGRSYWTLKAGAWTSTLVGKLGDVRPAGSFWDEDLTADQRTDINVKADAARIAGLSADAKVAELATALDGLATQAQGLADRAKIKGEAFDPTAWYAEQKGAVEAKYS